jgi:GT2 family glycosyltransferase
MRAEYVQSLVQTTQLLNEEGISFTWGNGQGSLIGFIRNSLWQQVRGMNFDKLVCIDSDISWEKHDFVNLTSQDFDILSGFYLNENRLPVGDTYDSKATILMHDLTKMNWVGFGFLAISKKVVEKLSEPFIREGHYGEDVAFSLNARDAGFDIWLDPKIRVTHHKTIAITP